MVALPEALDAALWLVAQSEPAREHLARLERLAADAGTTNYRHNWMGLLHLEDRLERLLQAPDDWQDPSDVLDPTRILGFDCQALYNLCSARIERSQGDERRRLEALRAKLERPAELQRLLPVAGRRFETLRRWLAAAVDAEGAAESLEEMARMLRSAL